MWKESTTSVTQWGLFLLISIGRFPLAILKESLSFCDFRNRTHTIDPSHQRIDFSNDDQIATKRISSAESRQRSCRGKINLELFNPDPLSFIYSWHR